MFRQIVLWLSLFVVAIVAVTYQRRWRRLHAGFRRMEEYADTLLQHSQGTILNVQGIASELDAGDPVRMRIEEVLDRAERRLSDLRERMQPHCPRQQDGIQ